ncbi:SDR family oxidoreductase [Sedimentibacter sp.]|uniref:SDR family oxidoreductase n=1 Tax=Sedimentibacter sp. TaxID=1960295 RepID=UPI000EB9F549|nr:SDR family oxidoreductase [Sedimentibacter sp.]HCX61708.1 short-chain dehydrogenase [Clostridiales bacterium]
MSNLFSLKGKVALVTGASSGLGVQFATALAREGADVAIVARRMERLNDVKSELEKLGVRVLSVQCDVTDVEQVKKAVENVKEHFGRIDILVNNAGVGFAEPAELQTDEQWNKMIGLNLNAVYFVAREVGKVMIEQKYGKIINIGSIHSTVAMNAFPVSAYMTAKGGVMAMSKALAVEWAKYNITVNTIGPSYFESEMTSAIVSDPTFEPVLKAYCPMGRVGKKGELDGAVVYFASDASSFTTGQYLAVDGGWTAI